VRNNFPANADEIQACDVQSEDTKIYCKMEALLWIDWLVEWARGVSTLCLMVCQPNTTISYIFTNKTGVLNTVQGTTTFGSEKLYSILYMIELIAGFVESAYVTLPFTVLCKI
jgi:hypothetical protein